jgi:ribosomal protein L7/L12
VSIIQLRIDPVFCGPVSVGTVGVIKLLRQHLGVSLAEAKGYVDRCIEGETVRITMETREAATDLVRKAAALETPATIHVEIIPLDESSR